MLANYEDIIWYGKGPFQPWLTEYMPEDQLSWPRVMRNSHGRRSTYYYPFHWLWSQLCCSMSGFVIMAHTLNWFGGSRPFYASARRMESTWPTGWNS